MQIDVEIISWKKNVASWWITGGTGDMDRLLSPAAKFSVSNNQLFRSWRSVNQIFMSELALALRR